MTLHNPAMGAASRQAELREAVPADAEAIGRITYRAFGAFHSSRGYDPDFPSLQAAVSLASAQIDDRTTFGLVAVIDGTPVGANFLTEGDAIRGVGPIAVDPDYQGLGLGQQLMQAVIDRGKGAAGIRLCQDAFNGLSMALYTRLGFDAREPLALLAGHPRSASAPDVVVRRFSATELDTAAALARRVIGFDRTSELRGAITRGSAVGIERDGRLVGYMTSPNQWLLNHAVTETEADLQLLILGVAALTRSPLSFLIPIRRTELFRWCVREGFRVIKPMTLMSRGSYVSPQGGYLPSVLY